MSRSRMEHDYSHQIGIWSKNIVNPFSFGCKGDGVTDDTTNLQNAINSLQPNQTIIIHGTFLISSPLTVATNKVLITGGGTIQASSSMQGTILLITADDVTVEKIKVYGNTSLSYTPNSTTWQGGIRVQGKNGKVLGCRVDSVSNGILCDQGTNGSYTGFIAKGNTVTNIIGVATETPNDGIACFSNNGIIEGNYVSCKSGTDARVGITLDLFGSNGTITNNVIIGSFRRSIHVEAGDFSNVIGNVVQGSTWWGIYTYSNQINIEGNQIEIPSINPPPSTQSVIAGIYMYSSTLNSVIGNKLKTLGATSANYGSGVRVGSGSKHKINNNTITGNAKSIANGIDVENANEIIVTGNQIDSSPNGNGIYHYNSPRCSISNNIIDGVNGSGIVVTGSSADTSVGNNVCNACVMYGIDVENSNNVACTGNRVLGCGYGGIYNWNSQNMVVVGNQTTGNTGTGISLAGTTTGSVNANNI